MSELRSTYTGTAENIMVMIDDLYKRWVHSLWNIISLNNMFIVHQIIIKWGGFYLKKCFRHGKKIWLTEFAMSGTNNAGKVESLSLDRFRFVQFVIYLHMFPFSYDLNLTIHCKGFGVHARHLANARGARRSFQIFLVHEQVSTLRKKTGPKFEWSTIKNYDQVLNIELYKFYRFQFMKGTIMENCRFADSNDHGCPFDDNNKAWWVCLDWNEVELSS